MGQETTAFIAIGSNIDPVRQITRCLERLGQMPESHLVAESHWYRTKPWGIERQAEFINLVVGVRTGLTARGLLDQTQGIESSLNRVRGLKNGPRTIDLDILLFGEMQWDSDDLTIPHPALLERDFMLTPLMEIAPDAIHPALGLPMHALVDRIRYRQIIERLAERPRPAPMGPGDPDGATP